MTFRHVVMLSWIDGTTAEQQQTVVDGLRALPGQIPEIRSYTVGTDAGVNEGNHNVVIMADFDCVDDYLVYRDHPVHRALIAEHISPILAGRAAVQHDIA